MQGYHTALCFDSVVVYSLGNHLDQFDFLENLRYVFYTCCSSFLHFYSYFLYDKSCHVSIVMHYSLDSVLFKILEVKIKSKLGELTLLILFHTCLLWNAEVFESEIIFNSLTNDLWLTV